VRRAHLALAALVGGSLLLNTWGNEWGAPREWHPDELTPWVAEMVYARRPSPGIFAYGGLHYYVIAAGAFVPVKVYEHALDPDPTHAAPAARRAWLDRHMTRLMRTARTISAVLSALLVVVTFAIGTLLFDRRTGLLAAAMLAASGYVVALAHFATVDAAANFWYWLACLLSLLVWKRGGGRWSVLAALVAGLAIGVKADRAVVLVPLVLSHLRTRPGRRWRTWAMLTAGVAAGFAVANPMLLIGPFEFLDGYTRDLAFNAMREAPGETSHVTTLRHVRDGLGTSLFVVAAASLAYAVYALRRGPHQAEIGWLLATVLPYYVIVGSQTVAPWYAPFFFPGLLLLAAHASLRAVRGVSAVYAPVARAAVALVVVDASLHAIATARQFSNDSRYEASAWLRRHVPPRTAVGMINRGPNVPRDRYHVVTWTIATSAPDWTAERRLRVERNRPYQAFRRALLRAERDVGEALGVPVRREPYRAWFDPPGFPARALAAGQPPPWAGPSYVVVLGDREQTALQWLTAPGSGYELAARFGTGPRSRFATRFPFIDPPVYVFTAGTERVVSSGTRPRG
jgi:hypothetical protein